jgi:hypothetical protein
MLNENIKSFKCLVKAEYFTKNPEHKEYHECYAFAIQSVAGKILTFHIITNYGMLRSRVPISEIFLGEPTSDIPSHYKQLWDCFSENVAVIEYDYLVGKRCEVLLKDGVKIWATYLFTVDWYDNAYSDEPTDYKCGHIVVADDGYLMCQPNNRIFWKDMNFIVKSFPIPPKEIKVDTELESVERYSDRWVSEDSDSFYYDIKSEN